MDSHLTPGLVPAVVGVGGLIAGEHPLVEATAEPEVIPHPEPAFQN